MIFMRDVEVPDRYAMHLPAGIRANTLAGALRELEQRYGGARPAALSGDYDEVRFDLEDRDIRFYRRGGVYVALRSDQKPRVQAFFRPCSGFAGTLTGTGSATGFALNIGGLTAIATARATASFWALWPMVAGMCAPCITVPLGPVPTAVSVARAGVLSITVTVDVTAQILCI